MYWIFSLSLYRGNVIVSLHLPFSSFDGFKSACLKCASELALFFCTLSVFPLEWAKPAGPAERCLLIHSICKGWKKFSAFGLLWPTTSSMWTLSGCLLLLKCTPRLGHPEPWWADRTPWITVFFWLCAPSSYYGCSDWICPFFLLALLSLYLLSQRCTYSSENGAGLFCTVRLSWCNYTTPWSPWGDLQEPCPFLSTNSDVLEKVKTQMEMSLFLSSFLMSYL